MAQIPQRGPEKGAARSSVGPAVREASHGELTGAEAGGAIAPEEKERLARALEGQDERQRRKAEDIAHVTEALAWGEKPDPSDPADRAAVEAHFAPSSPP